MGKSHAGWRGPSSFSTVGPSRISTYTGTTLALESNMTNYSNASPPASSTAARPNMAPGTRVKCRYRGAHRGTLLALDDPKAWRGTLAFASSRPSRRLVKLHVAKCQAQGLLRVTQPVVWPWGVMWDSDLSPA